MIVKHSIENGLILRCLKYPKRFSHTYKCTEINRGGSRTAATFKVELKSSTLDIAAVLDPPLIKLLWK